MALWTVLRHCWIAAAQCSSTQSEKFNHEIDSPKLCSVVCKSRVIVFTFIGSTSVYRCVCVLADQCVGQLCEPSLSQSDAEERQENSRAKKTVHLVRVLAEICPSQFTSSDVFENLMSLLRHEDSEIGKLEVGE